MTESIGFRAQVSIPGPLKKNVSRVGSETGRRGLSVSKITKLLCLPVFQDVLVSKVNRLDSFKLLKAMLAISCPKVLTTSIFHHMLTIPKHLARRLREPPKELHHGNLQPWVPQEHPPAVRGKHLSHVDRGLCWGHMQDWRGEGRRHSPSWVAAFFFGHRTLTGLFRTWTYNPAFPSSLCSHSFSLSSLHASSRALCVSVTQPCPTLCDPVDCSLPGFSLSMGFSRREY